VNDRGPYTGGRELDFSQGAAEYLGLTAAGVDYADYYEVAGAAVYAEPGYEELANEEAEYAEAEYDEGSGGEAASGGPYVVQSGYALTRIAAELGTSVDSLVSANGLDRPGLRLRGADALLMRPEEGRPLPSNAPVPGCRLWTPGKRRCGW
jgi:peptidoglycan lytic transglycosylase